MTGETGVTRPGETDRLDALFSCLRDRDRRRILGRLYDRGSDAVPWRDLGVPQSSAGREPSRGRESTGEASEAIVRLHHVHLPKLEAAGLIERDADRGEVRIADHPAFRDAGVVDAIGTRDDQESDSLDALFAALADSRRRRVLDVLSHQFHPIHAETLASEIRARSQNTTESNVSTAAVERVLASLHHVQLPALSEAGLIEYDADARLVSYRGHPDLRVPWMHSVLGPDFRASLTGEPTTRDVGTIEGREGIVSFGQSLCERADEELFCLFTATGLLEAGCLARIRDASRRGVDVYLGTADPTVLGFARENVPEAITWEPRTDWLDLPVEENRVGRLLLADREAVMLGTLGESDDDGVREEKALVSEGPDNALVVMVRQLLGRRLERIDEQTGDVQSHLPF